MVLVQPELGESISQVMLQLLQVQLLLVMLRLLVLQLLHPNLTMLRQDTIFVVFQDIVVQWT